METFAGWPYDEELVSDADLRVIGCPYEYGGRTRRGQQDAPRAIREAGTYLGWNYRHSMDLSDFRGVDTGDVEDEGAADATWDSTVYWLGEVFQRGPTLILGGDDSVNLAALQAHKSLNGPVGLLHFDAHPDYLASDAGEQDHATWVRDAVEGDLVRWVGQHGVRAAGSPVDAFTVNQYWAMRPRDPNTQVPVHVAFDLDVIDPAFAPGVGVPEPLGLLPIQAADMLYDVCLNLNVVSLAITEHVPMRDPSGGTSRLAFALALEYVAATAMKMAREDG